jgi:hypothetical protein
VFTLVPRPSISCCHHDPFTRLLHIHSFTYPKPSRSLTLQITHSPSFDTTFKFTPTPLLKQLNPTSTFPRAAAANNAKRLRTSPHFTTTMATLQSANPIYLDPSPGRTRPRRSSSRQSFTSSLSRSTSNLGSPRAICPKDGDAFSYDPAHLRDWFLPQDLWDHMPAALQSTIAAVQHSGAAVLTGKSNLPRATSPTLSLVLHCAIFDSHINLHM